MTTYSLVKPEPSLEVRQYGPVAELARPVARTAVNLASVLGGAPGSLLSLANEFAARPIVGAITGQPTLPYEQTPIGKAVPTIEQAKASLTGLAPQYLKPRNEFERFADEVVEDAATLALPIGGIAKGASAISKVVRPLAISLGSNLSGELVEGLTKDQQKGTLTKIGTMFALSLINKNSATKAVGELYDRAAAAIPEGATVDATKLRTSLHRLQTKVSEGTLAPSEKFVYDEANQVLNKIKDGKITPQEAWASKRSLNEKLQEVVYSSADKAGKARAKKLAGSIQHDLETVLKDYGNQNPGFYKDYRAASDAFGTIAKSNFVSRIAGKYLGGSPHLKYLEPVFGVGPVPGAAISGALSVAGLPGAATIGLAEGGYYAAKYLYRIAKDPTLRQHYGNALKAAAENDSVSFLRETSKLDDFLKEKESKTGYTLIK